MNRTSLWWIFVVAVLDVAQTNTSFCLLRFAAEADTAGWTVQQSPTTNRLRSVHFTDVNNGWAVGDDGALIHTTNGGAAWIQQTGSTSGATLYSVYFADVRTGWAVGGFSNSCEIIHTSDGGETWTTQSSPLTRHLESVSFVDTSNGWAVGELVTPSVAGIIHTSDGGKTWTEQSNAAGGLLHSVCFPDLNNGWAVGQGGVIIRTSDGGATWSLQSSPPATYDLLSVHFTDAENGWAVGLTAIVHTSDGGRTWRTQTKPTTDALASVYFIGLNAGWAVGGGGASQTIIHTTDGGGTWNKQSSPTGSTFLRAVCFIDTSTGWAVGDNGVVIRAAAGGGFTSVAEGKDSTFPSHFMMAQNYPNPFNPITTIKYELPKSSMVRLSVYDLLGREVSLLVNEKMNAGVYDVRFDASGLSSGVYFYRLQAGEFTQTKRLLVLR